MNRLSIMHIGMQVRKCLTMIGAHFNIDKGFAKLVDEASEFGANAFVMFTKLKSFI